MKKFILFYCVAVGTLMFSACDKQPADIASLPSNYDLESAMQELPVHKNNPHTADTKTSDDLLTAAKANNLEKMKEALQRGENVNTIGTEKIIGKITELDKKEGKIYYEVEDETRPWTALMWASDHGNVEAVKFLLSKGADTEIPASNNGDTALIIATRAGNIEIIKLLLQHNANVNAKNREGFSALALAAEDNNLKMVEFLLTKGADVNNQNIWDETPLMIASDYGLTNMVKLLLDNSAQINMQTKDGATALLVATNQQKNEIVKLLLSYKADVNIANVAGYTPLRIAMEDNNTELIKLFKKAGAKK